MTSLVATSTKVAIAQALLSAVDEGHGYHEVWDKGLDLYLEHKKDGRSPLAESYNWELTRAVVDSVRDALNLAEIS